MSPLRGWGWVRMNFYKHVIPKGIVGAFGCRMGKGVQLEASNELATAAPANAQKKLSYWREYL
jgi:hypothetical protein